MAFNKRPKKKKPISNKTLDRLIGALIDLFVGTLLILISKLIK